MIDHVRGRLAAWSPARLVVETGGIGLSLLVSLQTSETFSRVGETVEVCTHLHVREDALELFGFSSAAEREVFLLLITVPGVGPKTALRVLSEVSAAELARRVVTGDARALTGVKGIGKKTAEMILANLRTPLSKLPISQTATSAAAAIEPSRDAIAALLSLGVDEAQARQAIQTVIAARGDKITTSELVTEALKLV